MNSPASALVGIDWGTTNRRAWLLAPDGTCAAEISDDQGVIAARGRFEASLGELLARLPGLAPDTPVVMSGMVGSAMGWREVPYVDAGGPLEALGHQLVTVDAPSLGRHCAIVPGCRWRSQDRVDVMRGEETQLLGAVALGVRDGWFVLPGTHSKWAEVRDGRLVSFQTFMTGELYALLSTQGTLAAASRDPIASPAAFEAGVAAARDTALSNALFSTRARVVGGDMPAAHAASFLSGVLMGAEWHDRARVWGDHPPELVHAIGSPSLAEGHATAAALMRRRLHILDPREVHLAALRFFASHIRQALA
ncbi:2-dehydro-3-deoxygalactonokinase [Rhizobacter sp. Root1221]|uniref:2-dehydro-3-deoxygalactonokinase n=1 Tax=Rhizobacter sp. Root1221 TaxID=1736433 RepID=UPI000700CEF2|nr:2-dehydro-3-deoxygalactonokinase [Rhizobacter sp. Root1221]KQW00232.1 hypothetical protein ASC87_18305 [Rhizobacter sp. Root1221]